MHTHEEAKVCNYSKKSQLSYREASFAKTTDSLRSGSAVKMTHYHRVHEFVSMPQVMKIPDAKAAVDKEWKKLETIPAWELRKVTSKKAIVQKQVWKQSLEKKFCVPPARPRSGSRRRRQQGPKGSQRSTGQRVVNQKSVPEGRGSVRRDGLF